MNEPEDAFWSEKVKTKYHPPEGTFTHKAPEVVRTLMDGAHGDAKLALERLVFYMNRAGEKLENKDELEKAKEKLENLRLSEKNGKV